jgi:hypothetical protein
MPNGFGAGFLAGLSARLPAGTPGFSLSSAGITVSDGSVSVQISPRTGITLTGPDGSVSIAPAPVVRVEGGGQTVIAPVEPRPFPLPGDVRLLPLPGEVRPLPMPIEGRPVPMPRPEPGTPPTGGETGTPGTTPPARPLPILGTDGNDTLAGTAGDDVIMGRAGGDRLTGGAGRDVMLGGPGADSFVFGKDAVLAGQRDHTDADGRDGDTILFSADLLSTLRIGGVTLDRLTADTALPTSFAAGTNIAFLQRGIAVDLNADGRFTPQDDYVVTLAGVSGVTFNAAADSFTLGG